MSWSRFGRYLLSALFILYCIEAGVLLTMSPWRDIWPRLILDLPSDSLRMALLHPVGRSAVTGFGLVHLVWGLHDLHRLLSARRSVATSEPRTEPKPMDG